MHKNKLLIVDLDDTILNTSKIKVSFFNKISRKTQIARKDIEKIYHTIKNKEGYNNLIKNFLNKIEEKTNIKLEENLFYSEIKRARIDQEIISSIKKIKAYKILLTTGDTHLQNKKIKMLGIKNLFHKTKIIAKDKREFISSRVKGEHLLLGKKQFNEVIIVDDKAVDLKKRLPKKAWLQILTPPEFISLSKNKKGLKPETTKDSKSKMRRTESKR